MGRHIISENKLILIELRCCIVINILVLSICSFNTGISWLSLSSGLFTIISIVGYFITSKICLDIENLLKGVSRYE